MTATKNAHDWFCEAHGTYGWRGESCRQCPEAPSEIAELKRQLEAENERVEDRADETRVERYFVNHWHTKALESQAREARLREALEYKHDAVQSLMTWCIKNINRWSFPQYDHLDYANAKMAEALALPHDDTALKEYHDSIVEKCAKVCHVIANDEEFGHMYATGASECEQALRKLKAK